MSTESYIDIQLDKDDWRFSRITSFNVAASPTAQGTVLVPQTVLASELPEGDVRNHIKALAYLASCEKVTFIRLQKTTRVGTAYPPAYPTFSGVTWTKWLHPDGTVNIGFDYPVTPQWTTTPEVSWDTTLHKTTDMLCYMYSEYEDGTTIPSPTPVALPFSATLSLWNLLQAWQYWSGPPASK